MKVRSQAAAAALAVAGVSAQAGYSIESTPLSYTTVTYNDCPTASIETMITVTEGVTATYCPKCHHDESSGVPVPTKHTTVYTTVYQSVCETGLAPVTHTITETCDGPEPTWTHGPDYVPPGFTTTLKECQGCKGALPTKPVLVTITEPCDCEATSGTSVGPTPTGPPGQYPPPGGDNGGDNGSTPPKPSGGDDSGNPPPGGNVPTGPGVTAPTAAPYPTPSTTVKCPGPECVATGSSGLPPPAGSTPPPAGETGVTPPPYQGAASSYGHFGFAALSIVIGTLAFAL